MKIVISTLMTCALAASLSSAHAQGGASLTVPVPFPDARYSVGVFEGGGFLVRTLASDQPESQFPKALNGLVLEWDGKDEDAGVLPPGSYEISGVAIPSLAVSGVRYHFNDWLEDGDAMKVIRPFAGFQREDGRVAALVSLVGERLGVAWFEADAKSSGLLLLPEMWTPGGAAFDGERVLIAAPGGVAAVSWGATSIETPASNEPVMALDFGLGGGAAVLGMGGPAALSSGGGVSEAGIASLQDALRYAHSGGKWLGLAASGSGGNVLSLWKDGKWEALEIPGVSRVTWITSTAEGGFWVAGTESAGAGVAVQIDTQLEPVRVLEISDNYQPTFVAQNAENRLVLIEQTPASVRFRALRFDRMAEATGEETPVSIWQEIMVRVVQHTEFYQVQDGAPVPSSTAGTPPPPAQVALKANPLSGDEKPVLAVSAAVTPQGVWVSTADGLLIAPIGGNDTVNWAFATKGEQPGTVRIFEGTVFGIAEYSVAGLENIVEIDIGDVTLPLEPANAPKE